MRDRDFYSTCQLSFRSIRPPGTSVRNPFLVSASILHAHFRSGLMRISIIVFRVRNCRLILRPNLPLNGLVDRDVQRPDFEKEQPSGRVKHLSG